MCELGQKEDFKTVRNKNTRLDLTNVLPNSVVHPLVKKDVEFLGCKFSFVEDMSL